VASHRRPKNPSRTRVTVLTAAAATAVAITANAQSAQAAPQPTTASLKAQIAQLNTAADTAIQKYDGAQQQQQELQAQVTTLQNQVARQQAALNAKSASLGAVAAAQYRSGTVDASMQLLLAADPTDYLDQASTLAQLNSSQASELSQYKAQQATLDTEKSQAEAKLTALDSVSNDLAAAKATAQTKLAAAQALLNTLTAAQQQAVTGGGGSGAVGSPGGADYGPTADLGSSAPGDALEARAFAAAQTRIGKPYVLGATGPDEFDCSGLMMWAYAQAGEDITRTTYSQINEGTPVNSVADLQVGDLIFFNGDAHVGMYAGNGIVLHAPHPGAVVRYEELATVGSIYAMRHF